MSAIWKLNHRSLLIAAVLALPACSAFGPFSEYEKELINRPIPADKSQREIECGILQAHYNWSLAIIDQRDKNGWEDKSSKDVIVSDAWADRLRAKRLGCSGW
ncbi:hypothetical protein [Phytopseudomonas dryadis]|uniref:Lipoprotein n=1 Tax=Phytopseudomonas dryadis TaxID=2487520 RepID=A0ABY1Z168_9GAMM|nr:MULTISPECIES: hypothetical protein [Pseudomonas]TBV01231.1 hypothetical protein DNK34_21585 [Pseudomonas dryadis]TBV14731.1 hypothetical protein DNK41_19475 [Pseudomonas sp. FRB 230]